MVDVKDEGRDGSYRPTADSSFKTEYTDQARLLNANVSIGNIEDSKGNIARYKTKMREAVYGLICHHLYTRFPCQALAS